MNTDLDIKDEGIEDQVVCNEYLRELMKYDEKEPPNVERVKQNGINLDKISSQFKKFKYWGQLPPEIKCMIIKEVEFVTRFSLLRCSKNMHQLAVQVPINIKSIILEGASSYDCPWPTNTFTIVQKSSLSTNEAIFRFRDKMYTESYRKWTRGNPAYIEKSVVRLNAPYQEESLAFTEYLLKLANYQVDEFLNTSRNFRRNAGFLDKLQVKKKLKLFIPDENLLIRWLDTAKASLDELDVCTGYGSNDKISYDHETIWNARKITVSLGYTLTKSNLFSLTAQDIMLYECDGIKESAVNAFVKRWKNGGGPEKFRKLQVHQKKFIEVELLRGLGLSEWDDEFKKDNTKLCKWVDESFEFEKKCYYMESMTRNNGATLIVSQDEFVFLVTGKRQDKSE